MRWIRWLLGAIAGLVMVAYLSLVVYAYWPRGQGVPAESLATADDRFAEVNGIQVRFRVYGQAGEGRPELALIHGFANNLHSFRYLTPLLADCCHVLAMDLPGFGLSSKPADRSHYAYQSMADAVIGAARAAGFTQPVYGGHSLGGVIALRAGLTDTAARGLVFIEPGIYAEGLARLSIFSIFPMPRLSAHRFADREFRYNMIRWSYRDPSVLTEADVDNLMLAAQTDDYASGMTALLGDMPTGQEEIALLDRVDLPVLTLWAADGSHVPANSDRLQQALPDSRTVLVPDAGHYLHEEQPDRTATEIKQSFEDWFSSGKYGVASE